MRRRHAWSLVLGVTVALSCSSTILPPRGEILLAIESDLTVPGELDSIRVEIRDQGGLIHGVDYALAQHPFPATLGILAGSARDPMDVRVVGRKGGVPVVLIDARTTVPDHRIAVLPMPLSASCRAFTRVGPNGLESTCASGQTCRSGSCVDAAVDSSQLPDYSAGQSHYDLDAGILGEGGTKNDAAVGDASGDSSVPLVFASARRVALGTFSSCATPIGVIRTWGSNFYGQCGNGTKTDVFTPISANGLTDVVEVAAGYGHKCARRTSGNVRCWGDNSSGAIGDGTNTQRLAPVDVLGILGAIGISAGGDIGCVVLATGGIRCWGDNSNGQLGDGTTTQRTTPVDVVGISNAVQVAVGDDHVCALLQTGTVRCWGDNALGQLGDGTTTERHVPTDVPGLNGVVQIAAADHTCARLSSGGIRCWGDNSRGQLGDGTTTRRLSPIDVVVGSSVVDIAVGATAINGAFPDGGAGVTNYRTSCAVLGTGGVKCWGANDGGQIGDGTKVDRPVPTAVTGLANAVQVATSGLHSCALLADGTLRCWGGGGAGQVGDGAAVDRPTPVTVLNFP